MTANKILAVIAKLDICCVIGAPSESSGQWFDPDTKLTHVIPTKLAEILCDLGRDACGILIPDGEDYATYVIPD